MKKATPCLAARVLLRVLPRRYQYRMSQMPPEKLTPMVIGRVSMIDVILMALMFGIMSISVRPVLIGASSVSDLWMMAPIMVICMAVFALIYWALGLTPRCSLDTRIEDEVGVSDLPNDMRYKVNRLSCDLLDAWMSDYDRAHISGSLLQEKTQISPDEAAAPRRL